jgi:hypothetical protein
MPVPMLMLGEIYLSVTFYGAAAYEDDATLCTSYEEVYLSCHSRGKIISLCASGNILPDNGYVQYRFGTTEQTEFEFPKKLIHLEAASVSAIFLGGI